MSDSEKFVKIISLLCKSSLTKSSSEWDEFFFFFFNNLFIYNYHISRYFLRTGILESQILYLKLDFSQSGVTKYTT